jgi:hypothetical protein
VLSHQLENEDEVDQEIFVKVIFLPLTWIDTTIFTARESVSRFISSLENDVVVKFLNGLDMDENFENASMETLD